MCLHYGMQYIEEQPDTRSDIELVLVAVAINVIALNVLENKKRLAVVIHLRQAFPRCADVSGARRFCNDCPDGLPIVKGSMWKALLGRLTHPHIAELLDAGVSLTGQPFLVLEYVRAITLIATATRQARC